MVCLPIEIIPEWHTYMRKVWFLLISSFFLPKFLSCLSSSISLLFSCCFLLFLFGFLISSYLFLFCFVLFLLFPLFGFLAFFSLALPLLVSLLLPLLFVVSHHYISLFSSSLLLPFFLLLTPLLPVSLSSSSYLPLPLSPSLLFLFPSFPLLLSFCEVAKGKKGRGGRGGQDIKLPTKVFENFVETAACRVRSIILKTPRRCFLRRSHYLVEVNIRLFGCEN